MVSIGSQIEKIGSTSVNGFEIDFVNGDVCDKETGKKFKTKVKYVCDTDESDESKYPTFIGFD